MGGMLVSYMRKSGSLSLNVLSSLDFSSSVLIPYLPM